MPLRGMVTAASWAIDGPKQESDQGSHNQLSVLAIKRVVLSAKHNV